MGTRFVGRTLARSQALQLLFQAEADGRSVEEVLAGDYALSDGPLDDYGRELALGADSVRHDLDAVIAQRSTSWSLSRMAAVDRNLLRMSLYEMLYEDDVEIAVSIDECVELAKAYGTEDSSRFVNGVLGRVADDLSQGIDVVAAAHAALSDTPAEGEDEPSAEAQGETEVPTESVEDVEL